eukprot:15456038-Alexandrium_andersonii.AAC.1
MGSVRSRAAVQREGCKTWERGSRLPRAALSRWDVLGTFGQGSDAFRPRPKEPRTAQRRRRRPQGAKALPDPL